MPTRILARSTAVALLAVALPGEPSSSISAQTRTAPAPRASFGEPGISPDGSTVAFVSGGDIWEVAAAGGDARLLVSHPATESRPLFSPDGSRIAFTSTRSGNGDVYSLTFSNGEVTRLTFDDANELVTGWSPDSRAVYFSSTSHDLTGMQDVYRVGVEGGTPMPVVADRYTTEYFAAASPAGDTLAITARGNAGSQWWRKGHSHLDESQIWLVRLGTPPRYEPVTTGGAKDAWPMWAADGKAIYFMSDRSGAQNIWTQPLGGAARAVTTFADGRVLWPSITRDGKTIAFERNFGIWSVDSATARAREIPIALRGASAGIGVERRTFTDQIQEMALSPDGKKLALIVRGELFSASAKDGGDAVRLTHTVAEEFGVVWSPDSRRLVYSSERNGADHLFLYDFGTSSETQLTSGTLRDHSPRVSPDGKLIAFERGGRELRIVDPGTRQDRLVANGIFMTPRSNEPREIDWSPDSKFLAVIGFGAKTFQNVTVVPADGGDARPVSFLANANGTAVSWSPDGTYLTFVTSQRTEAGRVVRVDLLPRTPRFREEQFRDLFRDERPRTPAEPAAAAASASPASTGARTSPAAVKIEFDGIRSRASVLPVGVDVQSQTLSPDGKSMLLVASAEGQENLYVYSMDELSQEPAIARQLTSTAGAKRSPQFSPDSKDVFYLDRGRIFTVSLERREPRAIAVTAALDVDFAQEKLAVFHEAWSLLRDGFFDERMNGVDWAAVGGRYEPQIAGARTSDEMRRIISLMLGELNASHMGISAPPQGTQTTVGRLAIDLDRAEYERSGQLRIATVVPLGPASVAGIPASDYLRAVGGRTIGPRVNLDELLDHTIGRQVTLTLAASPTGPTREVGVKPVNQATEKALRYRQWVQERRAYVAKVSGGRLGYVHMLDMSDTALNQLFLDLDADNHSREGVVVDVRNNNGGFVNVYAIDVFSRRGYFQMARRGLPLPPVSSRTSLGQRALELPTILVTNQHSLSDAEDFTEGYRTLKLGKVVGEPTAGWIIYTGSATLVDGSVLRMPSTKIFANDGSPMEMHPRPVDIAVTRPVGESYSDKDVQLDTAVAELLKQLGPPATRPTTPRR
ncbi:MAG: S41 family peptidase [Vicinamibacterales bacterium]